MAEAVDVFEVERDGGTAYRRTEWGSGELRRMWKGKHDSDVTVESVEVSKEDIEPVYGDRAEAVFEHWERTQGDDGGDEE